MDEKELISEFMKISKCDRASEAISCMKAWNFDLKRALIDYNDTSTQNYFKSKTQTIKDADTDDDDLSHLNDTARSHHHLSSMNHNDTSSSSKDKLFDIQQTNQKRPLLTRFDSVDLDYKKLSRGISRANDENVSLVTKARKELAMDFHQQEQTSPFIDTPDYTFTLPDLTVHNEDFRKFLERDLIECATLNSLENCQRLNWWVEVGLCRKIWPLSTSGDGNCLLHAASLAIWGFHDRRLTLRKALHKILSESEYQKVLWRRWRFQQTRMNREAGLIFNETEWAKEWDEIVALASPEPRNNKNSARRRSMIMERQSSLSCAESIDANATYDSLEEIHVLALSYVLRRPIIVISDNILRDINGEALAPITFGGIYLPLDIPPMECHKIPLLLAYDMAHFSALVTMETVNEIPPALVPMIDNENILIPIQYPIDPGNHFDWQSYDGREGNWALTDVEHIALLKEYLEINYASPAISPDEEIYNSNESDEEYDKKILDIAINLNNEENHFPPTTTTTTTTNGSSSSPEFEGKQKSKSAAKLQSVAKQFGSQFGSLGRSVSKKIKKNIGSITKLGKKDNKFPNMNTNMPTLGGGFVNGRYRFLCAQLRAKRHDFQEEMIKNYLECAYQRFTHQSKDSNLLQKVKDPFMNSTVVSSDDRIMHCINTDCDKFGTEKTSFLCVGCYEKQKQRETMTGDENFDHQQSAARYGAGNSKFYAATDAKSHSAIQRLPSVKKLNELDQTLYLSKSTFYNDTKPPHNVVGIPVSPPLSSSSSNVIKGRTTIIPIRVEGRDDTTSLVGSDLIHFDSLENVPPQQVEPARISSAHLSNGTQRVISTFSTQQPSFNNKSETLGYPVSDQVDGRLNRYSYDVATKCKSSNCNFFGSPKNGFCSKCSQLMDDSQQQQQQLQQYRKLQTEI